MNWGVLNRKRRRRNITSAPLVTLLLFRIYYAQQKILEALAADASVNVEEVQRDTITVYAGISCDLRHNARSCPESRTAVALVGSMADDVCITAYAMTTPEAGAEPVSAIVDNIAPLFDLDPATLKETSTNDEQTYLDHIVDDLCLLALEKESTTFELFKKQRND